MMGEPYLIQVLPTEQAKRCSSPDLHHFKSMLPNTACDWCGATVQTVANSPDFKLVPFVKSFWGVLKEVHNI